MINNVSYELYKYFSAYVNITIPTIYSNAFSFYETCSKLLKELNTLKDNQDITSANYDLISTSVKSIITEQINNIDKLVNDFNNSLTEFNNTYENNYNNFIMGRSDYQEDYKNKLNQNVTEFINTLNTTTSNFITELENTYGIYTNNLNTIKDTTVTEFENQLNKYRDNIQKQFANINTTVNTYYETMINAFNDMKNTINNFNTTYQAIIIDIPEKLLEGKDFTEDIYNWSVEHPEKFPNTSPLFIKINYMSETEPTSPKVNEIWYNPTNYNLKQYNTTWTDLTMQKDKLYVYENRIFYVMDEDFKDYLITGIDTVNDIDDISFIAYNNNQPKIRFGTDLVTIIDPTTNTLSIDRDVFPIETMSPETLPDWYNVIQSPFMINILPRNALYFYNNKYYFSYRYTNSENVEVYKTFSINNLTDFKNKSLWTEVISESSYGTISNICSGWRFNTSYIPCSPVDSNDLKYYSVSSNRILHTPPTKIIGVYSENSSIANSDTKWLVQDPTGIVTELANINENGMVRDNTNEYPIISNGKTCYNRYGFAPMNDIINGTEQDYKYRNDSDLPVLIWCDDNNYYKFAIGDNGSYIFRTVRLRDNYLSERVVDDLDLHAVNIYNGYALLIDKQNKFIKYMDLNVRTTYLKEINYVSIPTTTN